MKNAKKPYELTNSHELASLLSFWVSFKTIFINFICIYALEAYRKSKNITVNELKLFPENRDELAKLYELASYELAEHLCIYISHIY